MSLEAAYTKGAGSVFERFSFGKNTVIYIYIFGGFRLGIYLLFLFTMYDPRIRANFEKGALAGFLSTFLSLQ